MLYNRKRKNFLRKESGGEGKKGKKIRKIEMGKKKEEEYRKGEMDEESENGVEYINIKSGGLDIREYYFIRITKGGGDQR